MDFPAPSTCSCHELKAQTYYIALKHFFLNSTSVRGGAEEEIEIASLVRGLAGEALTSDVPKEISLEDSIRMVFRGPYLLYMDSLKESEVGRMNRFLYLHRFSFDAS